jgi:hypothetical protein
MRLQQYLARPQIRRQLSALRLVEAGTVLDSGAFVPFALFNPLVREEFRDAHSRIRNA